MRKQILMFAVAAMFTTVSASAQVTTSTTTEYWVKTEPAAPHMTITRPTQPSPNAVWIDEDWQYNTNTNAYEWHGGHWETPSTPGKKWKKGKWKKGGKGYTWVSGTWY